MNTDQLLALFGDNKAQAAKALRVSRQTIINWSKEETLTPMARERVQAWFREKGKRVPKEWMP